MTTRHALFTPSDIWRIQGIDAALNAPMILDVLPRLNTFNLYYSSMLQAGIDKIWLPFEKDEKDSLSPFIRKHLVVRPGSEWAHAFFAIHEFFCNHVPDFANDGSRESEVVNLQAFLIDLLYALSTGCNLLNAKQFPDPKKLEGKLPAEILLPVGNLLDTFENINPMTLYPRMVVDKDNVMLFEEIIASERFSDYQSAHSSLEDSTIPADVSSRNVSKATQMLSVKTKRQLRTKKALISILPFSTRIVDMIFGALPGKLADQFARITQDWLTRSQRLVVYQIDSLTKRAIEARMDEFCKSAQKSERAK